MELFRRRTWRFVSAQLSIKFVYCPWCTVCVVLYLHINTTDYHWADTSLHLLLAIALPRYIFLPQRFRVERNCQNFENEWANPGALLVYFPSLKSNFYRKIAPRLQRALNSDRRSRSWAAWPLYQHHCPKLLCCQNDKNIILIHENSTKMSWIGAKYV